MLQVLSVFIGGASGLYWEFVANKPYNNKSTLIESIFIRLGNLKYHVHHWLIYVIILGLVIFWANDNEKLFHPAIIFIISFLLASLGYGFSKLSGWGVMLE